MSIRYRLGTRAKQYENLRGIQVYLGFHFLYPFTEFPTPRWFGIRCWLDMCGMQYEYPTPSQLGVQVCLGIHFHRVR